jgi:hypothetical protein
MKIRKLILENWKQSKFIGLANKINSSKDTLELMHLIRDENEYPIPEYGSWLLLHISKKNPKQIFPIEHEMIDLFLKSENQSVLRNIISALLFVPLSTYREGEFLDKLIHVLNDDKNKIALQVNSLYKLIEFTKRIPEIYSEIENIISLKQSENIQPALRIGIRNYLLGVKTFV